MKLRPYQEEIVTKLVENKSKEICLAACPSSGKTFMAIEFIKRKSKSKFLVLTHGTNVLKNQWEEQLKTHIPELISGPEAKVVYGIPQSLKNQDLDKVDYLIIDEAHEFSFAKTVVEIIRKVKPRHIIYLTGTPSVFIQKGIKTLSVPAEKLIEQGYISDLYIGLFQTKAGLGKKDRNSEGDVSDRAASKIEQTVEGDLDNLLIAMSEKLKIPNTDRDWDQISTKMGKTMVVCRSVKQAERVENYLNDKGVVAISSNSENDKASKNISRFLQNKNIKVLIVVDRAILGFNMPELVSVIDMTCSLNVNRIYQLFARVMRKNINAPNKFYFKLSSEEEEDTTKFYTTAAIMMTYDSFLLKFNGRNLNGMEIPVERGSFSSASGSDGELRARSPRKKPADRLFNGTVTVFKIMKDICASKNGEYSFASLGDIMEKREVRDYVKPIVKLRSYESENARKSAFADALYFLISSKGVKQREIAEIAGVSPSTVSSWIKGSSVTDMNAVANLSRTFKCSFSWMLTGIEGL